MIQDTINLSERIRKVWLNGNYDSLRSYFLLKPDLNDFVLFNGSFIRAGNDKFTAFRAVYKGINGTMIDFPFMKYKGWHHWQNFIGIIHRNSTLGITNLYSFKGTDKTYPEIDAEIDNTEGAIIGKFPSDVWQIREKFQKFKNLDAGPEDPRLYISQDKKITLQYNMNNRYTPTDSGGGCSDINIKMPVSGSFYPLGIYDCTSIYEAVLYDTINPANTQTIISGGLKKGEMLCKNIYLPNNQIIVPLRGNNSPYSGSVVKNWSSTGTNEHYDVYNLKKYHYISNNTDRTKCALVRYNEIPATERYGQPDPNMIDLKKFFSNEFSIAMTTPTIEIPSHPYKYGVAHIRISLLSLTNLYNKCPTNACVQNNPKFFQLIKKNLECSDNSTSDIYTMCLYRTIDFSLQNTQVSNPFIVTGNLSDNYYSYLINFPCGISFHRNLLRIDYGIGDCMLFSSFVDIINGQNLGWSSNTVKNIDNINVITYNRNNNIFDRQIINRQLYIGGINLSDRYTKILFDLGGSGLKIRIFHGNNIIGYERFKLKDENYIGYMFKSFFKRENGTLSFIIGTGDRRTEVPFHRIIFGFSSAELKKLWDKTFLNSILLSHPKFPPEGSKLKQIVSLPLFGENKNNIYINKKLCIEISDIIAHFYSCCDIIFSSEFLNNSAISGNILVISKGTFTNMAIGRVTIGQKILDLPLIGNIQILDNDYIRTHLHMIEADLDKINFVLSKKIKHKDINWKNDELDELLREFVYLYDIKHIFITGNAFNDLCMKPQSGLIKGSMRTRMLKDMKFYIDDTVEFFDELEEERETLCATSLNLRSSGNVTIISSEHIPFYGLNLKIRYNMENGIFDGSDD